ncbi:P-loop containing nucleoside triphosphate hydrolase protein [Lasiosphaeris hirsuta]|uniref:ATP-dependent RNA helicase n=1 Tax=Lasiosphaeris hirsuta TaxID=260670 RepID=A0AA40BDB2_9PEZI|nr:P-loop containing nucleoside triphosphate hydrolase protein [Lasiosphaeris hirsuta]
MDILKVLSRGLKPNPQRKAQTAGTPLLPSSGSRPNPQFFHDDIGTTKSKKRKRRKGAQADDAADGEDSDNDSEVSDVDYFNPKPAAPAPDTTSTVSAPAANPEPLASKPEASKLLDEDECRQILRSHRLKLTILSRTAPPPPAEEPPTKRSRKGKKVEATPKPDPAAAGKDDKKQIYPQPLAAFGALRYVYDVHPTLAENLTRQGFRVPTEVQMGALPLLLRPQTALKKSKDINFGGDRGVDFLGVAPTGSGKTISFLIPAIDGVMSRRGEVKEGEAREYVLEAIVVAPTRELASQIVNEGRKLALGTGVRVVLMKKSLNLVADEVRQEGLEEDAEGVAESKQEDGAEQESEEEGSDAEKGDKKGRSKEPKGPARVDILVTTPKILLNFLTGGKPGVKRMLPSVRSLILDEADVLLDPIFRKQTLGIWRACINPDLSLTCWSATMGSNIETLITKQVEKRAKYLRTNPKPLVRLVVGLKDTAVPNITHKLIYTATEQGKLLALRQLLHPVSSADSGPPLRPPFLVFTQTIERAQSLHDELKYDIPPEAGGSARIAVLHSSLPDSIRSKIMTRFRAGDVWVLITTDVLARGVDFAGVNGVVNYDVPGSAAAYVHRSGRTGRAGREGGVAVTFYTKDDIPFVKSVANVIAISEKQAGKDGKAEGGGTVQKWLLDALPKVAKVDKRKLKVRGVESRRTGGKASITTQGSYERRKENNMRGAIEASKKKKREAKMVKKDDGEGDAAGSGDDGEWGGLDD